MQNSVQGIFNSCKNGEKSILACRSKIIEVLNSIEEDQFKKDLDLCLRVILLRSNKSKNFLRCIELLATFITSSDILRIRTSQNANESNAEIEPIFYHVISDILKYSAASCRFVRLQACTLLSRIVDILPRDIRLDVSLLDEISEKLRICLKDTSPNIRVKAIQALSRIQDPEDEGCLITEDYMQLLEYDTNPTVRLTAATYMCITNRTLPVLVRRVHDVRPAVRQAVFNRFSKSVPLKAFKIDQRVKIISAGLSEKTPETKAMFKRLLVDEWFININSENLSSFVSFFDAEEDREFLHRTLGFIFLNIEPKQFDECVKSVKEWLDEFNTIQPNLISKTENVLIWHAVIKFIMSHTSNLQGVYISILPELINLSKMVDQYMNDNPNPEILIEIFSFLRCFDMSDEAGRKKLLDTLSKALLKPQQVGLKCIPELVRSYLHMSANSAHALDAIVEVISEIRQPLISLPTLNDDDEIKSSEELINDIQNENNQNTQTPSSEPSDILLSCLAIISETIQARSVELNSPAAVSLLHSFILPLVQDLREPIRAEAVRCLALFCVCVKDFASKFMVLLVNIVNLDTVEIKNIAISALFDIFTLHGFSILPDDPELPSSANVVEYLLNLADKESHAETLLILISGIAKLFLFKRIFCERALSFLMLCYLNQSLQKEKRIRLVLSQFFSTLHNKRFLDLSETVVKACVLTLKEASLEENSSFDFPHFVNLISNITDFYPGVTVSEALETPSLRENLVLILLKELFEGDNEVLKKIHLKILSSFSFLINTESGLKEAQKLLNSLTEHLKNGQNARSLRILSKIDDRLCLRDFASLINNTHNETNVE